MNYGYGPEPYQYNMQAIDPMLDNQYVGADSEPVSAQQFWGYGPGFGGFGGFGGPFFGGGFFRPSPFFGSPFFFRRPFWGGWGGGWGGWW